MDAEVFGAFVQSRRKQLGLSQLQLAEKLHVTAKAVSRWERGVGFPDIKLLEPLAEALEVTIVELMQSKMIEQDLSKETASAVVSDTVSTLREQQKQSRKKIWKLVAGSVVILLVQAFLITVYYSIRSSQPRWMGAGVYFIAYVGGVYCLQFWRGYVMGDFIERRKMIWTWQLVLSVSLLCLGVVLMVWGVVAGALGPVSGEYVFVAGMAMTILSAIYGLTHAEEKEEQETQS